MAVEHVFNDLAARKQVAVAEIKRCRREWRIHETSFIHDIRCTKRAGQRHKDRNLSAESGLRTPNPAHDIQKKKSPSGGLKTETKIMAPTLPITASSLADAAQVQSQVMG